MKIFIYIIILTAGFHFNSSAQAVGNFANVPAENVVKFYPNPAVNYINFEFNKNYDKSYSLIIFNFIGKKMLEQKILEQKIVVPLTDYYRGVYVFQIRNKEGAIIESGKFQVTK